MSARPRVELPPHEAKALRSLRESGDLKGLRQRVYALRQAGWPLRAIGDPLDSGRSTVRMWELGADPAEDQPSVTQCPRGKFGTGERVIRLRPDVPPNQRTELRRLAESARTVRGWTPKDAQSRKDAEKLDALLATYISRGVPKKRLAAHTGVTYRAVSARIERREAKDAA